MNKNRPISPHLTIYKHQITSMLSFFHRMSGVFLSVSVFFFIFAMKLATFNITVYGVYSISHYMNSLSNWIMISFLFSLLFSLYYHLYNGIRHLFWDMGSSLEINEVYSSGYIVLFLTIISTLFTWIAVII